MTVHCINIQYLLWPLLHHKIHSKDPSNNMKKTALVVLTMLASSLQACGSGDSEATPTASSGGNSASTCASFTYQQDAQAAFNAGATQLDGDNDGIACEELPRR
jgi:Excalibur calcium-binding domain